MIREQLTDTLADLRVLDLPFEVDEVREQCHNCIRKQLKKYDKYVDGKGRAARGNFTVPCSGIPNDYINPIHKPLFSTQESWDQAEASVDIVKWAAQNIRLPNMKPWIARWYQERVLRCSSRRKMLRIARRTGKTDSVCVEICYYLFTSDNIKIVVAGPQKSHTEEIITRIRGFINNNPDLAAMVVRDVSAPWYEIELSNGSRLRGFAAGTKGKGGGIGIRGQDADRLYMEEMDYIEETAIRGAVLPILQTTPHTALVGFSTPSGFQTPYYMLCEQNPNYVEYHYNYKVLPHWRNVEMERSAFTEEEWTHEYMAEWGSSESGVYRPAYIDKALHVYEYGTLVRSDTWKYCIGTDWNEKHGTEIVVLGYNIISGKFQVAETVLVPGSEFTQLSGINKLLELNKKWRPAFVYIDAGNGSTNYELLRKTAYEQRHKHGDRDTARLLDTLKKYDAGSSIQIKDPITGQDKKIPAKPFMVNASVRMFEQCKIAISSSDHVLEKQLRNYIIERYTPTKTPVYGLENPRVGDHRLDALNLAIVAFHLEFDDLHTIPVVTSVAIIPSEGSGGPTNRTGEMEKKGGDQPADRRLEGSPQQNPFVSSLPGKVDNGIVKTNRVGWDRDEEGRKRSEWLHRKRSRGIVHRDRPNRSTF